MKLLVMTVLSLVALSTPWLLSGCGKVCVAGLGDCSEFERRRPDITGGDLRVRFEPKTIQVNGTSNLIGTGGRPPCTFKLVSGPCQLDSFNGQNCTGVVRGTANGACKYQVTDADSLTKSDLLNVEGGTVPAPVR